MTKKTTIFRQLILTILVPVILVIALIGMFNYYDKKNQIQENRKQTIRLIQTEVGEFLTFFDFTLFELEKEMAIKGEYFSKILVEDIFSLPNEIKDVNLDSIHDMIGMDHSQDIYIIDTNGVIVNTTYPKDLGLDFYALSDYFKTHFKTIREHKGFIADRMTIEMTTNLPKKYMYRTTNDSKYIIELGFYYEPAQNLVNQFINKLNAMPERHIGIDTVSLFFGNEEFSSYQKHLIPHKDSLLALSTLISGIENRSESILDNVVYTSEYSSITMESSLLHKGYLIRIVHNNKLEKELLRNELKWFILNILFFGLPILFLILWRARVLSRPISQLVQKMEVVREGNLNERALIQGSNEVTELGKHFNAMIDELQDSYSNLEQKVADRTAEVRKQKEILEEVFHEIQDSIKYAKRLQQAILPSTEVVNANLQNFILYRPKDVVSGDFYWFEKKDDIVFIAAADCTGHGVPGAMVSVVCSNALNRAVNEFELTNPADILNKTRALVIETFSKSGENVKDGMDISLCSIQGKTVNYAGANNPFWLLEENSTEIIEIKADKQPIGNFAEAKPFTSHEIVLKEGDLFFLFTDGYADQFGGDKGKKLKYKPFKELLIKNANLPLSDQAQELSEFFDAWKNHLEQIDDVCVIGVRI